MLEVLLLITAASASAADFDLSGPREIKCTIDHIFKGAPADQKSGTSGQFGVVDIIEANCDQGLRLQAMGYGLGVRLNGFEVIGLGCFGGIEPGNYWGVKGGLAWMVGMNVGFFANKNRLCYLASVDGIGVEIGASVSKFTIKARD